MKFLGGYDYLILLTKASLADSGTVLELPCLVLSFDKKDMISTSYGSSTEKQLETECEWGLT